MELTWELRKVVANARKGETTDADTLFEQAGRLVGRMNEDCVKLSKVGL
jgi:hypothetical protein